VLYYHHLHGDEITFMEDAMKWFLFVLGLVALSIAGCDIDLDNRTTLPNGIVIDRATKDHLIALESQFTELVAAKSARTRTIYDTDLYEPPQVQAARELLLREFGAQGLNYIIIGKIGSETIEISPPSGSRYLSAIGDDGVFVYYLEGLGKYVCLPWGAWNWAESHVSRRIKATGQVATYSGAAALHTKIVDSTTPSPGNESWAYQAKDLNASGNTVYGFFPPHPTNITTWHDAYDGVYYNGEAHLVLHFL
jgi:hypothetical protein